MNDKVTGESCMGMQMSCFSLNKGGKSHIIRKEEAIRRRGDLRKGTEAG